MLLSILFIPIAFLFSTTNFRTIGDQGLEITLEPDQLGRCDYFYSEAVWMNDFGEPNLPSVVYKIGLPQDGSVEVKLLENQQATLEKVLIDPVVPMAVYEQPFPDRIGGLDSVYRENAPFPGKLLEVTEPAYYRDLYTVDIKLYPVQYNPVKKTLVFSTRMRIKVKFNQRPKSLPPRDISFDDIYRRTVLNYEQCKTWRREPKPSDRNQFTDHAWFKIQVPSEGIYKISHNEIKKAGLDPQQFDPATMKIWTANFELLSVFVPADTSDSLIEIPVYVKGENDHRFDPDDYLIFYAYPANHFIPDTPVTWFENGYAINNVYWFTFGGAAGKRMKFVDALWDSSGADTTVNEIVHLEQDAANPTRSGTNWYWKDVSPGMGDLGSASVVIKHPHGAGTISIRTAIFTLTNPGPFIYEVVLNDSVIYSEIDTVYVHDRWPPHYFTAYGRIKGDSSSLVINIRRPSGVTGSFTVYLNSFDISYERATQVDKPFHAIFSATPRYSLKCSGLDSKPFVLDVTDMKAPNFYNVTFHNGQTLHLSGESDSFQLLYFSQLSRAQTADLIRANPGNLRAHDEGAEYVIITHRKFYSGLLPFVKYRQSQFTTKIILVDEIFDDFAYGRYDPIAIKHFLYYTLNNWTTYPKYVFLVGDATYDYKNNLQKENPPNYVPMYESGTTLSGNAGMPPNNIYEAEYVNFGLGEAMVLGRVTVRTTKELRDFIDKLSAYETKDIDGLWNKRVLYACDDEWATNYGWEGTEHCGYCQQLETMVPDTLYNSAKVYMLSYPPFAYDENTTKPAAQADFIKEINKGALLGVFFGHGNTHQLSHQFIFYQQTDIPKVNNGRRNCIFYYASCTVGRFDDSDYECIGEEMVRIDDGAIGTVAATSGTSGASNAAIGAKLFELVTDPDTGLTMGECFFYAKRVGSPLYVLQGDPATRIRKMTERADLLVVPDSAEPLDKIKAISGEASYYLNAYIRDTTHIEYFDQTTVDQISGHVWRAVQNGSSTFDTFDYKIEGKEFYQGYWTLDTAVMFVPKIITTHRPVVKVTDIRKFKSNEFDSIRVYGSAAITTDTAGPLVELYDHGRRLRDGDWVDSEFVLTGIVTDESGINLLNSKENARGFYLYVNQKINDKIDLRNYFMYDQNSYTTGKFSATVALDEPVDTITLNVNDNNLNQTIVKLVLNTEFFDRIGIENFLVYPNPAREAGAIWFTFDLTSSARVSIKIFTVAGRLIKTIDKDLCPAGYNQVLWDGQDEYRDDISNGVYIVHARVETDNDYAETTEKFIIAR